MKLPLAINKYGDNEVYQFSQVVDSVSYGYCFRYATYIACCSLMNYDPGKVGLKDFLQYFVKKDGGDPKDGGNKVAGAEEVLEYWNKKYPHIKCKAIKLTGRNTQEHRTLVNQGLPCVYSIWVGDKFREDRRIGKISGLDYSARSEKEVRTGHAIMGYKNQSGEHILCDSSNAEINQYKLPSLAWMNQVQGLFKDKIVIVIEPA